MEACVASGIDGFIIVDLPPEEGEEFIGLCDEFDLSFVPLHVLNTPESSTQRIRLVTSRSSSFVYCVSQAGVTGARQTVPPNLEAYLDLSRETRRRDVGAARARTPRREVPVERVRLLCVPQESGTNQFTQTHRHTIFSENHSDVQTPTSSMSTLERGGR